MVDVAGLAGEVQARRNRCGEDFTLGGAAGQCRAVAAAGERIGVPTGDLRGLDARGQRSAEALNERIAGVVGESAAGFELAREIAPEVGHDQRLVRRPDAEMHGTGAVLMDEAVRGLVSGQVVLVETEEDLVVAAEWQ